MWKITGRMSNGYQALREDGEMVFIYKRPNWGDGRSGAEAFFELRNRGALVGRISRDNAWQPQVKAEWLAAADRPLNETDLMEITAALPI